MYNDPHEEETDARISREQLREIADKIPRLRDAVLFEMYLNTGVRRGDLRLMRYFKDMQPTD